MPYITMRSNTRINMENIARQNCFIFETTVPVSKAPAFQTSNYHSVDRQPHCDLSYCTEVQRYWQNITKAISKAGMYQISLPYVFHQNSVTSSNREHCKYYVEYWYEQKLVICFYKSVTVADVSGGLDQHWDMAFLKGYMQEGTKEEVLQTTVSWRQNICWQWYSKFSSCASVPLLFYWKWTQCEPLHV